MRKKCGDIRVCVDFRNLNGITEKVVYPIPSAQELFDKLHGAKYFTTLDLCQGYYQIPMAEADRQGQFQFKRIPFGLSTAAPASFQKLMRIVLKQYNWKTCLIYLDDVLIFSNTFEEHLNRLKDIFYNLEPQISN